jgi:hypothetical protein
MDVMSPETPWKSIDTREDLAVLDRLVVADDSRVLELYASQLNEPFFPADVCRDGYQHLNWRLVMQGFTADAAFVEVVFIACDMLIWSWMQGPHFDGRVDSLRRVELYGPSKAMHVRCARLIYRTHSEGAGAGMRLIAEDLAAARRAT